MSENADVILYRALSEFIERYVNGLHDMEVGELLGALNPTTDGTSMDPAAFSLWQDVFSRLPLTIQTH